MADQITNIDLKLALREHTDEIMNVMQTFMQQVSESFIEVNNRLDEQDKKYDRLN